MTTIKQLAKEIQKRWPDLQVVVERGYASTDRKIPGTRLRRPGKGRTGTRIKVYKLKPTYELLLDHNQAETHRRTSDVIEWMERYAANRSKKR